MSDKKKKKRVGSTIFRIVLIVIAGLTVGLGVFHWNAAGLVGNQLPMPFGFGVSVVMSPSMEPVLKTNDLIFVTEADSYDVDDIVVYQEGNMLVIHRIVDIDGDKVITKGDANNAPDDPVSMDDIKAKLSFRIPFVGVIFKYLKTVPGTLLVLVLAIFLLYRSRQKERDKDKEELEDIVEEIKRLRSQQNGSETEEIKESESSVNSEKEESEETTETEASKPAEEAEPEEEPSEPVEEAEPEEEPSEPAEEAEPEEEPSEPAEEAEPEEESDPAEEAEPEEESSEPTEEAEPEEEASEPAEDAEQEQVEITSHETAESSIETPSAVRDEGSDFAEVKSILEDMSE